MIEIKNDIFGKDIGGDFVSLRIIKQITSQVKGKKTIEYIINETSNLHHDFLLQYYIEIFGFDCIFIDDGIIVRNIDAKTMKKIRVFEEELISNIKKFVTKITIDDIIHNTKSLY